MKRKKIKVLLTGTGAPGTHGTVYALRENPDNRDISIIGTDCSDNVIGHYLCDGFYPISPASNPYVYLGDLRKICEKEQIDVILPQNTAELPILAASKSMFLEDFGTKIAVSSKKSIDIANNKYRLALVAQEIGVPVPKFEMCSTFEQLLKAAQDYGWPNTPVVVKPPCSNGSRGLRIVTEEYSWEQYYHEKPNGVFISMSHLRDILGDNFRDLLVCEYLPGYEYTVDLFRGNGRKIEVPRKRDVIKSGITFNGTTEDHPQLAALSRKLADAVNLEYCFGFQFKLDADGMPKLLECNPRVQGTMLLSVMAGANIIYAAVKMALGEEIPKFNVKWKTRLLRYWGGVGVDENGSTSRV